jgi:biotin synthase
MHQKFLFLRKKIVTPTVNNILNNKHLSREEIDFFINLSGSGQKELLNLANETVLKHRGNKVYYRGLIELSNICIKDCFYCGIRKSNHLVNHYELDDDAIMEASLYAWRNKFGSIVLQSGERSDTGFINKIDALIRRIKKETNNGLGITLSLGEQTGETYRRWFESGAHRYLLRIETSNPKLYSQIHPSDEKHSFSKRIKALETIKKTGYQTGSGVMVGLPGQTTEHLAEDLLFLTVYNIDMVGMGPYIEHENTPMAEAGNVLWPLNDRFNRTLNMIAILRLILPDINIASTTALQAIDPLGREKALQAGANIIMPNITPAENRKDYLLYDNKPCTNESADDCLSCLNIRVAMAGREPGLNDWGDSPHYYKRCENKQKP